MKIYCIKSGGMNRARTDHLLISYPQGMQEILNLAIGIIVAVTTIAVVASLGRWLWLRARREQYLDAIISQFLAPLTLNQITIRERKFPYRLRADLQRAIDQLLGGSSLVRFLGVSQQYAHESLKLADCLNVTITNPVKIVPPQYEELDLGEEQPGRVLVNGVLLLMHAGQKVVLMLGPASSYGHIGGMSVQLAIVNEPVGHRVADELFQRFDKAVAEAVTYRGKILSLEKDEYSSTDSAQIKIHRLRQVEREQIILPRKTLDLLDRNILGYVQQRPQLKQRGFATKKGLLFYGPPGTGKTHTIHYLARALPGHTTLLITAEQVGLLDEYMILATLFQPSIVVIEDADLIGRERTEMSTCEELTLNKLLNIMDGLWEQSDTLFILTTNRPAALEPALAARPGRVDQAIEFPLPDDEGRAKLVQLYAGNATVSAELCAEIVRRTQHVSAAFIKELMRRSLQFQLERDVDGAMILGDVEGALEDMLHIGGSLNLRLLGAEGLETGSVVR
jgi:cell division protease FtsH